MKNGLIFTLIFLGLGVIKAKVENQQKLIVADNAKKKEGIADGFFLSVERGDISHLDFSAQSELHETVLWVKKMFEVDKLDRFVFLKDKQLQLRFYSNGGVLTQEQNQIAGKEFHGNFSQDEILKLRKSGDDFTRSLELYLMSFKWNETHFRDLEELWPFLIKNKHKFKHTLVVEAKEFRLDDFTVQLSTEVGFEVASAAKVKVSGVYLKVEEEERLEPLLFIALEGDRIVLSSENAKGLPLERAYLVSSLPFLKDGLRNIAKN